MRRRQRAQRSEDAGRVDGRLLGTPCPPGLDHRSGPHRDQCRDPHRDGEVASGPDHTAIAHGEGRHTRSSRPIRQEASRSANEAATDRRRDDGHAPSARPPSPRLHELPRDRDPGGQPAHEPCDAVGLNPAAQRRHRIAEPGRGRHPPAAPTSVSRAPGISGDHRRQLGTPGHGAGVPGEHGPRTPPHTRRRACRRHARWRACTAPGRRPPGRRAGVARRCATLTTTTAPGPERPQERVGRSRRPAGPAAPQGSAPPSRRPPTTGTRRRRRPDIVRGKCRSCTRAPSCEREVLRDVRRRKRLVQTTDRPSTPTPRPVQMPSASV